MDRDKYKDTTLKYYKNPKKRIEQIHEHGKKHYKGFLLTFNKEKDKELIETIENTKEKSKSEEVRKWFKAFKN